MSNQNKHTNSASKEKIIENKNTIYVDDPKNIEKTKPNSIDLNNKIDKFSTRTSLARSIENFGYIAVNKMHKIAIYSIFSFIVGNIFWLLYKYNRYWKKRRVRIIQ